MTISDDELREAFVALEGSIPHGYFDHFSDRVAGRLEEVEAMQGPDVASPNRASSAPPPTPGREEHSGLHEIKELATTTKKRLRRRRTTESGVDESLLASSTSGLHAVVLPEPGKEAPPALATATPAPAESTSAPRETGTRRPLWLYGAFGAVAAAAAIAAVVVLTRGGAGEEIAQQERASDAPAEAAAPAPAAEAPEPAAEPVVESLGEGGEGAAAGGSGGAELEAGEEPGGLVADSNESDESEEPEDETPRRAEEPRVARPSAASTRGGDRERRRPRKSAARETNASKKSAPAAEAKREPAGTGGEEKSSGGEDIDDILSDVTGGVEESAEDKKEEAKPKKKGLDRSDVARAMGAVRGRADKCQEKEGVTGTVSVRFTVQPSGKLTKISATGKHKGTPTGKCVAAAVKSASFPAYEGRPMTFTFPFLLSQ